MLETLITSKTRLKLLIKFFVSASNQGHLRGLAEEFQESTNAIRKELNQLSEAGYLEKKTDKNKILYRANSKHSLFKPLQQLIHTHLGIDHVLEYILTKAGDVQEISLLGDYAKGLDSGRIDVLILGKDINQAYLLQLADKASEKLNKEVCLNFIGTKENFQRIILYSAKTATTID
ncbi:ArsR family transcriptional regulator [Sphingobacterium sp. SRCM116780]|uniref:ArsR family transcriptional regulator n=1 Tax=Sphingobacterium sp. SRCM116780 TaxID=2907623 RepID=UPI001F3220CD|nr:ArsR family transcriptional regulator [Sphingobacterium sp. SRCM116780]UIR55944.1 ArsR family transcriptional regulator [Sphingobacterium sp. SRCM116780]